MRHPSLLLLVIGTSLLIGCANRVELANHDARGLVRAIAQANSEPGKHVIRLANRGVYILDRAAEPGLLLPRIRGELVIEGVGAEIRGYSDQPLALLQVEKGARLSLDRVTLAEGSDGAVRNFGRLRLDQVGIIDSTGADRSAIVLNHGELSARDSEIAYNTLAIARRDAGTVLNYGTIDFERTVIHDNRAVGRSPDQAVAGGILNFGALRVDRLTLTGNEADDEHAGLNFAGILNLGNGIVEGDTARGAVRDARGLAANGL
jgi:hypothetical protein